MPKLFEESDSDVEIKTNNEYAMHYKAWRGKEELNKLKTKYGNVNINYDESEEDLSSSENEDDGEHIPEEFEKDFFKTLSCLKNKDPKIYDNNVVFFEKPIEKDNSVNLKQKEKPMFMKDFERVMILEKGPKFEDSDEDELVTAIQSKSLTYVEEQERIKESLKNVVDDNNDNDETWGGLFNKREKTQREQEQDEEDYKKWLKGQKQELDNKEIESDLKALKDFWTKPDLDKSELYLKDYILNKRYLEKENSDRIATYDEILHDSDKNLSEDEETINRQEEFELKYNHRFEEPDQEFIKRYPRTMEHSVRKIDDRRKLKRDELKKRKEIEKQKKQEELKQLKKLKVQEIEEKIQKIKQITGNEDMPFTDLNLEGDFDPEEHDKKMKELFNDTYYQMEEDIQKPEYKNFEEELGPWRDRNQLHDEDFIMDCDYDPEAAKKEKEAKSKRKRNKKVKKNGNLEDELPLDTNDDQYEKYMNEIYKLDYEDMIGDIPCRFKYREVIPNDFGLSIEEILLANDKELNRWCSLKKTTQYRPEEAEKYDVIAYKKKGANEILKKKYLPSIYADNLAVEQSTSKTQNETNETDCVETKSKNNEPFKKEIEIKDGLENNYSILKNETQVNLDVKIKNKQLHKLNKNKINKNFETLKIKDMKPFNEENSKQLTVKKQNILESKKNEGVNTLAKQQRKNKNLMKQIKMDSQNKKRKLITDELITIVKKQKLHNFSNQKQNECKQIYNYRLESYGINPKNFKNKLKYKKPKK